MINWSLVARENGIQGRNAGQIAKVYIAAQGIDTSHIATPRRKPTVRPCKKRLPGTRNKVSVPSNPPIRAVEADIQTMISSGRFTLGEECVPYTITRYTMVDGIMTPHNLTIQARKIPLTQIRQQLLNRHQKYMRLTPESTIMAMSKQELTKKLDLKSSSMSEDDLRQLLLQRERSRSLCMWYDHGTILKTGFIMVTVHVLYDPITFYTNIDYQELNPGVDVNIQSEVEQPEIHLLAVGSSSVHDQAALIGDRLSCIQELCKSG